MSIPINALVLQAEAAIDGIGHAPSTRMQYRWAWSQFESFCSHKGVADFTDEEVASFLQFVAAEHVEGRFKDWKAKLLRKSVLVLSEVASTGSYRWHLSKAVHPNDALDVVFRPVQDQFESWLGQQGLAEATMNLYATVARTILAWLPARGVTEVRQLSAADISSAVVFLGEHYRPGSMRTVATAMRVLCRFLEETGACTGLSRAVPRVVSHRTRSVGALPAEHVEALTASPNAATPAGRRDRALLLLAARTGLRPIDMLELRLVDINWRQSRITLTQHKTGTVLTLPLLADVGEAIADYLLNGRPTAVADEHVFLRAQAPYVALSPSGSLYYVAERAFARTDTTAQESKESGRGFRVLRASFATRMLEADTVLPVISGALGHRGTGSAKHYLAADEQRMRQCCLDFTGIEPPEARQ